MRPRREAAENRSARRGRGGPEKRFNEAAA